MPFTRLQSVSNWFRVAVTIHPDQELALFPQFLKLCEDRPGVRANSYELQVVVKFDAARYKNHSNIPDSFSQGIPGMVFEAERSVSKT